jgi:hypothetical protein
VTSTWIKAIKNGKFASWPGPTEQAVEKHSSKSVATVKGNLNKQIKYALSTQPKKEPECSMELETNSDDGLKHIACTQPYWMQDKYTLIKQDDFL